MLAPDPLTYPLRFARVVNLAISSEDRAPACSAERWQRALRADRLTRALAEYVRRQHALLEARR